MFSAMAAHDVLFDEDACTVIKSSNGQPTTVPTVGDIENVAAVLGEGGSLSAADLYSTGQAVLGTYKYAAYDVVSREAFEDLDSTLSAVEIFRRNFTDRFARGIGKDLVTGSGSSKPLGLIPSLLAAGVPAIAASGAAANTGGSETGVNSLGSVDFQSALSNLDDA
jgi:HK97 family phage major capsid protein